MVDIAPLVSFDGTTPCWNYDTPSSRDDQWRLKVAQYGDGYSQRTLDGINALDRQWTLTWMNRSADVVNSMIEFFEENKAHAFNFFEHETGKTYRVFCDKWSINWAFKRRHQSASAEYYGTLTATFIKANGVTI